MPFIDVGRAACRGRLQTAPRRLTWGISTLWLCLQHDALQVRIPQLAPRIVVHVVPVVSLTRRDMHTVEEMKAAALQLLHAAPAGVALRNSVVNYEGAACLTDHDDTGRCSAYAQVFRDGRIELVGVLSTGKVADPAAATIYPAQHELPYVNEGMPAIAEALVTLGIPAPVYPLVCCAWAPLM